MHEVATVVNDDVRLDFQRFVDIVVVLLVRAGMRGKDVHAVLHERGGDIVLRRERVAARDGNLGARMMENLRHVGRLGLEVQRDDHFLAREGLAHAVLFIECTHDGHEVLDPLDFVVPARGQLDIFNQRFHRVPASCYSKTNIHSNRKMP